MLNRAQDDQSGWSFSSRSAERMSKSAEEFSLQLKSLFLCLSGENALEEAAVCVREKKKNTSPLSLHSPKNRTLYQFSAHSFPLSRPTATKPSNQTGIKWPFLHHLKSNLQLFSRLQLSLKNPVQLRLPLKP